MKLSVRAWFFVFASFTLQILISLILRNMPQPLDFLKLQTAFTVSSFTAVVVGWTDITRATFLSHYLLDFLYPIFYSLAFFYCFKDFRMKPIYGKLALLAGLCDEVENTFHALLVNQNISVTGLPVFLGAFFATLKWLLLFYLTVLIIDKLRQMGNIKS